MGFKKGIRNPFKRRTSGKNHKEPKTGVDNDDCEKKVTDEVNEGHNVREEAETAGAGNPEEENSAVTSIAETRPEMPEAPENDAREIPPVKSSRSMLSIRSIRSKKSQEKPAEEKKAVLEPVSVETEAASADPEKEPIDPPAVKTAIPEDTKQGTEEAPKSSDENAVDSAKGTTLCGLTFCLG
jgi:hypothetical protein